jgi:SAM-dependent methyltransferase
LARQHPALSFDVLRSRKEIERAERELQARDLCPPVPMAPRRAVEAMRRRIGRPDLEAELRPDAIKSWDVLRSIKALEASIEREAPILDVGSVASAILPSLYRLGYTRLHGIDLDEKVRAMPHAEQIDYVVGDLTKTDWPDGHFAAVTAISVIEHGVSDEALLGEVARLLRPGGLFIFSTDFWPDKIDTSGIELFGVPWRIFSADEIDALVDRAAGHGFVAFSDHRDAIRSVEERPIHFEDRNYTFLYGALQREDGATAGRG